MAHDDSDGSRGAHRKGGGVRYVSTKFSLSVENERADGVQDSRT